MNEFESRYWQSGYVDTSGRAADFGQKQDYEDAVGKIIEPLYADLWTQIGTPEQQQAAREIIEQAEQGDRIEIELGSRHFYVRPFGAKASDGLDELRQEAEQLWEPFNQSDEYFAAQLKYEQLVEDILNDPSISDDFRREIIAEHREAVSGIWLDAHPQFRDGYDFDGGQDQGNHL